MAGKFGAIGEFISGEESWDQYVERLQCYFDANEVTVAARQQAIMLSVVGSKTYGVLRGLSDNKPRDKTFAELVTLMRGHLHPAPNEIAERFMFYSRERRDTESISQYIVELRKLTEHCNFGDRVNEQIRDRLVCGVKNEKIQQKLLSEKGLNLDRALEIVISMEAAVRYTKEISGRKTEEHSMQMNKFEQRECYRCGSTFHLADSCPFKSKECFACKKIGHTRRKCRMNERRGKEEKSIRRLDSQADMKGVEMMEETGGEHTGIEMMHLYSLENRKSPPLSVVMQIEGKNVKMEVDTGATVTVMGRAKCTEIGFPVEKLKETSIRLKTYTGEVVKPEGILDVVVEYEGQVETLPLVVVSGVVPTLLGRNWLKKIKLDWCNLFPFSAGGLKSGLNELLSRYSEVFSEEMGCLKNFEVRIPVDGGIQPKFFKARPVPYSLRDGVDKELDRLEEQGIF